ncbi:SAM-dependent methyltransferase [Nocardia sp. CA2R105]|uniref:SAM-dependent methyltransferase n=1 Tax=Nocardia coffeae TaxID=2873381 RepID=UPI001CA6BD4B|nr:SAM-dependent methyltransferase [Nocardia coffeae]MBY8862625.1 SAM-dependent methyltransferase [Nocardia coffeae]
MDIDRSKPHIARMYDWYLGGENNYEADREHAARVETAFPSVGLAARVNRAFMHRATRWLASRGIRQFLDLGSGIPTEPNLHQVAQAAAAESRVVYVDNDPTVLTHARTLLISSQEGRTAFVDADVRAPQAILDADALRTTLDLSSPVAVSLTALLHFIPDGQHPNEILGTLMDAVPSGSYLVLTQATADFDPDAFARIEQIYASGGIDARFRTRAEFEGFFTGLELADPGIEVPHRWHPETPSAEGDDLDAQVSFYAGVARKP